MITSEVTRQFEGKLSQYGFEIRESFKQNEKGSDRSVRAEVATEKGEHLSVFLEETENGMLYRFQPLDGEFAGKTFTLDESELEKALPLIQKNLNEAARLKIKKNWHFTNPLQNFLPMPMIGATQLLREQMQKDEAKRLATSATANMAGQQMQKKVDNTATANIAALFAKTKSRKVFTGFGVQVVKPLPVAEKIRGEIPATDVFTQSGAAQKQRTDQSSRQQMPQNQPQPEEDQGIQFAQTTGKTSAKKSKLLPWFIGIVAGGSAATIATGGFSLIIKGS